MIQNLTKKQVIASLLAAFKEVQEASNAEEEVILSSRPAEDFVYIDSEILLQITGVLSEELEIEVPAKCQLFLGKNGEALTIEGVADKLMELNSLHESR